MLGDITSYRSRQAPHPTDDGKGLAHGILVKVWHAIHGFSHSAARA